MYVVNIYITSNINLNEILWIY